MRKTPPLKRTILLVDDDALIRELAGRWLRGAGYQVDDAADGRDALTQYRERQRDLVITDVMMPVMEGLETIRELHQLNPRVRIVAMTGASAERADTYLSVAKDFGAREILRKPFSKAQLIGTVERVLGEPDVDTIA